jgi:YggT family protein
VGEYLVFLVSWVVRIITVILILNALISFAPLDPWHPVRRTLNNLAEPLVRPFRNLIPPAGMFDFSVMVALIAYQLAGMLIVTLIRSAFS